VDVNELQASFDAMITETVPDAQDRLRLRVGMFRILDAWKETSEELTNVSQLASENRRATEENLAKFQELVTKIERMIPRKAVQDDEA
jgi:hypothetical protein